MILGLQCVAVVRARFVEDRYFAWAMFHMQARYSIEVVRHGRMLPARDIATMYRIPPSGTEERSMAHIMGIVTLAEERHGIPGDAVTIRYRIAGVSQPDWHWP
jgi:hypothetical protein